jgi:hypothetical protein
MADRLQEILDNNLDVEITFDSYQECFGVAIAQGRVEIFEILLDHYKKTKLQGNPESYEYKNAKHELYKMITEEKDYADNPKIIKLIEPYCIEDSEDDNSKLMSDFDNEFDIEQIVNEELSDSSDRSSSSSTGSTLNFANLAEHTEYHKQKDFNYAYDNLQKAAKHISTIHIEHCKTELSNTSHQEFTNKFVQRLYERYSNDLLRFKETITLDAQQKHYNIEKVLSHFPDPVIPYKTMEVINKIGQTSLDEESDLIGATSETYTTDY